MFRRFPYWGWLLISMLLWGGNAYYYHLHTRQMDPSAMADLVEKDLHSREAVFEKVLADESLMHKIWVDSLSLPEVKKLEALPFYLYAYEGNYLRFWNTNAVIPSGLGARQFSVLSTDRGFFVVRQVHLGDSSRHMVALMPVLVTYPVENDYLHSHFAASESIPANTRIILPGEQTAGAYKISGMHGTGAFYLLFNIQDIQKWSPGVLFIVLLFLALLASISWIHLIILHLTRNVSSIVGFIATLAVIVAFRAYLYINGPPFNLDTLVFFSPRLYASSVALPSFGDLFINTLCILWLVLFLVRHTPYKSYFEGLKGPRVRTVVAVVLVLLMLAYVQLFVHILQGLVIDSSISFDVSRFYSIDTYTILGLLVICIITGISCVVIYLFNFQLQALFADKMRKYGAVVFAGAILLLISGGYEEAFRWYLLGWLVLFLILLDIPRLHLVSDLFEPQMIFWALFTGVFCTELLQYFNDSKEKESRKAFVEQRLAPHRDNVLEYTFDKTAKAIERDNGLKHFFLRPLPSARKLLDRQLDSLYFTGPVDRYEATIYLFDVEGRPLYNKDSIEYYRLLAEKEQSITTSTPSLFFRETMPDKSSYLSYIPVLSDTAGEKLGYVFIDLSLKKQAAETVYPELLLPTTSRANPKDNEYSYAVYVNGYLTSQTNEYPFATFMRYDTLKDQDFRFYKVAGVSELHYRVSDKRTIVVVHNRSQWIEHITVFSYLFSIQVALAIVILLYQLYLSYFTRPVAGRRYIVLTLRKRIQYAMLTIVFVSFVFIGIVTVLFFTSRYRSSGSDKLRSAMQVAQKSVQDYLTTAHAYDNDYLFDSVTQSGNFRSFLSGLAGSQKIDINLYDNDGNLFAASQDEIFQRGLLARIMRPDAFYQLGEGGKSILLQNENVAGLSYLSAYEPLRDDRGIALGYVNVPFFSSERDLKFQISNIVITLINVYAFIFLISSLITVWITRWVTGSFNLIIRQFGKLNLQQNERIVWPYNDEIGMLVMEYNKMVDKVEANAALLARSERETAWREMARQVAHEIKNPLTPMKLNIQYLQQAIRNDSPNIKDLTKRVSEAIIEQIDNLSYIASEFSNFAKMPEARPEVLNLVDLVQTAAGLYRNEQRIEVTIAIPNISVNVYSDHSQLLRTLTNLLENAKQAIDPEKHGKIDVGLAVDGETAVISITDNGHGISEEVAQKIFQPYFTTRTSGTGLGLAMTRKIIEFWKGEISFQSEEGQGTTFYIKLPIVREGDQI